MAASVLGPGSNESVCDSFESPFWVHLKHETHWLSKLDICGAILGAGSPVGMPTVVIIPLLLRRSSWFWVPSQLWVAVPRVGFMASFLLPRCGFLLILPDVQALLNRFLDFFFSSRGNYSICSCRLSVSIGGGEFMTFSYLMTQTSSVSFECVIILCP